MARFVLPEPSSANTSSSRSVSPYGLPLVVAMGPRRTAIPDSRDRRDDPCAQRCGSEPVGEPEGFGHGHRLSDRHECHRLLVGTASFPPTVGGGAEVSGRRGTERGRRRAGRAVELAGGHGPPMVELLDRWSILEVPREVGDLVEQPDLVVERSTQPGEFGTAHRNRPQALEVTRLSSQPERFVDRWCHVRVPTSSPDPTEHDEGNEPADADATRATQESPGEQACLVPSSEFEFAPGQPHRHVGDRHRQFPLLREFDTSS